MSKLYVKDLEEFLNKQEWEDAYKGDIPRNIRSKVQVFLNDFSFGCGKDDMLDFDGINGRNQYLRVLVNCGKLANGRRHQFGFIYIEWKLKKGKVHHGYYSDNTLYAPKLFKVKYCIGYDFKLESDTDIVSAYNLVLNHESEKKKAEANKRYEEYERGKAIIEAHIPYDEFIAMMQELKNAYLDTKYEENGVKDVFIPLVETYYNSPLKEAICDAIKEKDTFNKEV